jgi:hypothetical protein
LQSTENQFASEPVAFGRNDPDFGPAGDARRLALSGWAPGCEAVTVKRTVTPDAVY